ncbi:MAG TPA: hypothetical protein VF510_05540, partial [Ktedonobacterales bacterium]
LLRSLLGLEPVGDHLLVDPAIPAKIESIQLLDIPGRWGLIDAFGRGRIDLTREPALAPQAMAQGVPVASAPVMREPSA